MKKVTTSSFSGSSSLFLAIFRKKKGRGWQNDNSLQPPKARVEELLLVPCLYKVVERQGGKLHIIVQIYAR